MLLNVNNVSVHYSGMQALYNVNILINEGEIVSILGANGAGKSTLINSISGMRPLSSGTIHFKGQEITRVPAHERVSLGIVQVPEGRKLFPLMTVHENLLLGSSHPAAKKQRHATLAEVYELLPHLRERKDQIAKTLSGGEQQMVAIGRALMSLPKLLVFDEPSLGLAPIIVKQLFEIIKNISDRGITIIIVEQNVKQTLQIVDRSYVIENGSIELEGTGEQLLNDEHVKRAFLGM